MKIMGFIKKRGQDYPKGDGSKNSIEIRAGQ